MAFRLQQFRDPNLALSGNPIGFYPREFYTFDNFSSFQVEWRGRKWPTAEHAFQASRFFISAPEITEAIFNAPSAHDAQKLAYANTNKLPKSWQEGMPSEVATMEEICKQKLLQHAYVQKKLLETGDLPIVEDSPKDAVWGWGPNKDGRNELGKIWMRLRDWLKENPQASKNRQDN